MQSQKTNKKHHFWGRSTKRLPHHKASKTMFILRGFSIGFGFSLSLIAITPVVAQTPWENPLQVEEFDDPLLPQISFDRPLSPLEKFRLEEKLDQFNQEARQQYEAGNIEQAFSIWYRELRLRQKLDLQQEVKALGRVGEITWLENRSSDFRNIRQRLREIETIAREKEDREILLELATSYEKMRELEGAIALYQDLSASSDRPRQLQEKIANLYQAQFNYQQAGQIYQTLLAQAETENNITAIIKYLKKLQDIYEKNERLDLAIAIKQRLIVLYQQQNKQQPLPALMVSLGEDYTATQQLDRASETYQEAFRFAWSQKQSAIASEALVNLAQLYYNEGNLETTIEIYEQLLIVQEASSDYYGLMTTYDKMGAIYQERNNSQQALIAYEKALDFARSLSYQEDYFQKKIQSL